MQEIITNDITRFSKGDLEEIIEIALSNGGEFAEIYLEGRRINSFKWEEGKAKNISTGIIQGVGIRILMNSKTYYVYADNITSQSLENTACTISGIIKRCKEGIVFKLHPSLETFKNPSHQIEYFPCMEPIEEKLNIFRIAEDVISSFDKRINQVSGGYYDESRHIRIFNSEGLHISDRQALNSMVFECLAIQGTRKESGRSNIGGRLKFSNYTDKDFEIVKKFAKTAAEQAITNLKAIDAPAGLFPVVVGPGWGGLLVHESVGHSLEADHVAKGTSVFGSNLGVRIGSEIVTLIDDGTFPGSRGSFNYDDEGTPGQKTVLIDKGILTNFMTDRLSAEALGMELTGNGRRQSYRHIPLPRMSNTYIAQGESDPDEILKSVKKGVYAKNFAGGMVDQTTGNFTFTITEGYLIENGKLTYPIKRATLTGCGAEILKKVEMVGSDFRIDKKSGHCGKENQMVPVGLGQPTIKISEITVGGTG